MEPGWKPALLAAGGYSLVLAVGWWVTDAEASATTLAELFRTLAFELLAATVFLVGFVQWLDWDAVWRDPRKLGMTKLYWWVAALIAVAALFRLDGAFGSNFNSSELWWIAAFAALVGFNEELLFRGIWLRSMRVGCRCEGRAAIYTALAFGLFHVANIFIRVPGSGFGQVFYATVIGLGLYLWRRGTGSIFPAMFVHGLWDFAALAAIYDGSPSEPGSVPLTNLAFLGAIFASAVAAERIWKGEKSIIWQRSGAGIDHDAPLVRIDSPAPATATGT
jgi:membrane protease YdiL (CAAX protease family)